MRLSPAEAVTIARELTVRASRGDLPGIPSPHVVRFTGDGEILIEGPVAAGKSVDRAARLLDAMLPGFDAPADLRVPGALRLVLARAFRMLDVPAYPTLEAFASALARFAAPDPPTAVRDLVTRWCSVVASSEPADDDRRGPEEETLSISDVRRARRATGLTLTDISERTQIPLSLLRELEWGYLVNWPPGGFGRTHIVRYARAAGLDEEVVLKAVLPELDVIAAGREHGPREHEPAAVGEADESDDDAPFAEVTGVVPFDEVTSLVPFHDQPPMRRPASRRRSSRMLAALALPALVAVALVPAIWSGSDDDSATTTEVQVARDSRGGNSLRAGSETTSEPIPEPPAEEQGAAAPTREPVVPRPSPQTPVTARPAALQADAAFSPAFASAGSAMFYHADAPRGSAIMRADTNSLGEVLRVTSVVDDRSHNFHARPSPDGQLIAFDSDCEGERAVYIADANGANVRRVTGDGFAAVPSWSPDGTQLAYVRAEPDRPRVWNLWTVELSSGETRRLTSHRFGQPWGAVWFPDGRRIAYSHEDRLVVQNLDGTDQRVYSSPRKGRLLRTPAVAPDGKRVIFQVYRDGAWMLDLGDGSMRKILSDPTAEEFTWSPDGTRVAYHSRKTGNWGVWIMAPR